MTAPVLIDVDSRGVARLTLNRPDRRNASGTTANGQWQVSAAADGSLCI